MADIKDIRKSITKRAGFATAGKFFSVTLLQLALSQIGIASTFDVPATPIGTLNDLYTASNNTETYYKFVLPAKTGVTAFLNGLSAGYKVELLDANGTLIKSSSNRGTLWVNEHNTGTTGGSVAEILRPNTYYVHVVATELTGNPDYRSQDGSFTINIIPDNAPNTVVVPGCVNQGTGNKLDHDEVVINKAIALVGRNGGGRVLLRAGTYHISNNIRVNFDNVTLMGSGWGTVLRLDDQTQLNAAGLLRSRFNLDRRNANHKIFSNQHFMHFVLDGNKAEGTSIVNGMGNFGTYADSSFEDIRSHDFPVYGFDPYESFDGSLPSTGMTFKGVLADHNGYDGIVFDTVTKSTIIDSIIDSNTRHGINLVANSNDNIVKNNLLSNNGENGAVIQTGSNKARFSDNNIISVNKVQHNGRNGIYVSLSNHSIIADNDISYNGRHGIHVRSSSYNSMINNVLADNSAEAYGVYNGVNLSSDSTSLSSFNEISKNKFINSAVDMYKFGVAESDARDDNNSVTSNNFTNIANPVRLKGPNSIDQDNSF